MYSVRVFLCLQSPALCHSQLLRLRPGPLSRGPLGPCRLNEFQQHQEPQLQASNLFLDYSILTPLSVSRPPKAFEVAHGFSFLTPPGWEWMICTHLCPPPTLPRSLTLFFFHLPLLSLSIYLPAGWGPPTPHPSYDLLPPSGLLLRSSSLISLSSSPSFRSPALPLFQHFHINLFCLFRLPEVGVLKGLQLALKKALYNLLTVFPNSTTKKNWVIL